MIFSKKFKSVSEFTLIISSCCCSCPSIFFVLVSDIWQLGIGLYWQSLFMHWSSVHGFSSTQSSSVLQIGGRFVHSPLLQKSSVSGSLSLHCLSFVQRIF